MTLTLCTIDSCMRPHKGHGLCDMHLQRQRRTGTTNSPVRTEEERFWAKVDRRGPDECWNWTAATNDTGYGVLRPAGRRTGPALRAHRFSAELAGMNIDGLHVLHSCDNRRCVNPAHLRPGTDAMNMADAIERDRIHRGEARTEARLTDAQVATIKAMLTAGELHKVIAAQFGVNRATVSMINTGRTWTHVPWPAVAA